jgi:chromatin remodeling complex protein RSC6
MQRKGVKKLVDTNIVVQEVLQENVVEDENTPSLEDNSQVKKARLIPTKDSILSDIDEILNSIETEIGNSTSKNDVKFLRSLNKRLKVLKAHSVRVMKQKSQTPRQNNANSGFQKPVKLSKELVKFTGWSENEMRSRVDVTKFICDYIAQNNLQNPNDRRQIWPDVHLQKLLGVGASKDIPLHYYDIQTHLKKHFPKE